MTASRFASPPPTTPDAGHSIAEMLTEHEARYGVSAGRIASSRKTGVHMVEVQSTLQTFTAPRCDFHRFNFQLSGHMTLIDFDLARQTKRKPGYLTAGSFAYIPCGTTAVARVDGDPFHILQVMIPRSQMRKALRVVTGAAQDDVDLTGHIGSAGPAFLRIGQLVHHEFSTMSQGNLAMIDSLSDMLCIALARAFGGGSSVETCPATLSPEQERCVVDMLPAVMAKTSRLGDIADALGLAPYQFTRRFTAHFGESPSQYMLRLRLERVRETLVTTSLPLQEIAYSSGFSSQAHMTTAFSTHFGVSPGRYRARQVSDQVHPGPSSP